MPYPVAIYSPLFKSGMGGASARPRKGGKAKDQHDQQTEQQLANPTKPRGPKKR